MRYYAIFAINKQNKKDILGYVEHSFSMAWENGLVNLWQAHDNFVGRKGEINGRSPWEYEWHWAKQYAKAPEGYELVVCRVNSKYCPAMVDTRVREGMRNKTIPYDKFKFRNAKFTVLEKTEAD